MNKLKNIELDRCLGKWQGQNKFKHGDKGGGEKKKIKETLQWQKQLWIVTPVAINPNTVKTGDIQLP